MKYIKNILAALILLSVLPTSICLLTFDSNDIFLEEAWLPIFGVEIGFILVAMAIKWALKQFEGNKIKN